MSKIVLASNNSHKIKEFEKILDGASVEIISQSSLNIHEAAETGLTFIENAILKARNACFVSGLPAIADDSGIEVDALSGRPGIYSARYAGEECDDEANNALLLEELKNIPFKKRTARYHCTIAFLPYHDCPVPNIYNASWEGYINEARVVLKADNIFILIAASFLLATEIWVFADGLTVGKVFAVVIFFCLF